MLSHQEMMQFIVDSGMTYRAIGARVGADGATVMRIAKGNRKPRYPLCDRIAELYCERKRFMQENGALEDTEPAKGAENDNL